MTVKILLVAEVELPEDALEPEDTALGRVETLARKVDNITFYKPAIGWTTESGGTKSAQVFY
jgi:hypothetical protein